MDVEAIVELEDNCWAIIQTWQQDGQAFILLASKEMVEDDKEEE